MSADAEAFLRLFLSYLMILVLRKKSSIRNPDENLDERPVGKTWLGPATKSPSAVAEK